MREFFVTVKFQKEFLAKIPLDGNLAPDPWIMKIFENNLFSSEPAWNFASNEHTTIMGDFLSP